MAEGTAAASTHLIASDQAPTFAIDPALRRTEATERNADPPFVLAERRESFSRLPSQDQPQLPPKVKLGFETVHSAIATLLSELLPCGGPWCVTMRRR